ncbi:MAG TPA: type II CAAX endopeptidase family protein [Verrucomicrobiae bacterium]|nr:type II CAAX endopeptidase family protein [Verrucomicrobiae bacterium]
MLPWKPWKPERVAWLLIAFMAANLLGVLVVQGYSSALSKDEAKQSSALPKEESKESPAVSKEEVKPPVNVFVMLAGTLMYQGVTLVLIGVFLRIHAISWADAFGFKTPRLARTLGLALLATAIVLPIAMALGWVSKIVLEGMGWHVELQESVKSAQTIERFGDQVYFAIVTIILAPFMEEVLFRGVLYPAVKQAGFPKIALWSTSMLFAFFHANAMAFVPLLFMAVILVFLYETTGNLLAPIVTHALFNATNYALLLNQQSGN